MPPSGAHEPSPQAPALDLRLAEVRHRLAVLCAVRLRRELHPIEQTVWLQLTAEERVLLRALPPERVET